MQNRVFQLLVDNNSGVLSRISGLFSRRGYNIESITAGVTADSRFSRITIVTSGEEEILDQIEKQVAKLIDVRDIRELKPEKSAHVPGFHNQLLQSFCLPIRRDCNPPDNKS